MEEWVISSKFPRMRGVLIQLHWHVWVRLKRGDVWSSWPVSHLALLSPMRLYQGSYILYIRFWKLAQLSINYHGWQRARSVLQDLLYIFHHSYFNAGI